ncbi:MAG TPA: hypothetical protein QGF58_21880 [Myxococcota bacterium]|nr:hypothetical protein [Myxococcota bacterium]
MREVTDWLRKHRRSLRPATQQEVRLLYRVELADPPLSELRALYAERVEPLSALSGEGHPPALVHELLRQWQLDLDELEALEGDAREAAGLTLGVAAVLVASGIVAGGVPPSPGALRGVADALRRSASLLGP